MSIRSSILKHHKKGLIGLAILVILLVSLHLIITQKAAIILEKIVQQVSKGKYTLQTGSVKFGYFPESIHATAINIQPAIDSFSRKNYQITIDTLHVKIRSIWPLLFKRTIDIEDISLVNPSLVIIGKSSSAKSERKEFNLHENLFTIQQEMQKLISVLRMGKFRMDNLSLKIYDDTGKYFLVDRVFLHIENLIVKSPDSARTANFDFSADIHFWLDKPNLIYPDSNLSVSLDNLDWNTKYRILYLENIGFSWRKQKGDYDSIHAELHKVTLSKLNYKIWFDTGKLDFDSIAASSGQLVLSIPGKRSKKDSTKISKDFLGLISPLSVKHFIIREVQSTAVIRPGDRPVSLSVRGDSLRVQELSIDNQQNKPFAVASLDLFIREFMARDQTEKWQSSFSSFRISKDHIALRDYVFQSAINANQGLKNIIKVPRLDMNGLSIPSLLDGKLEVNELFMDQPNVNWVAVNKPKKDKGPKLPFKPLIKYFPFLNIKTVRIQNGSFNSLDPENGRPRLQARGVYGLIQANKLLSAKSTQEFPNAFGKLGMVELEYITPTGKVNLTGIQLIPSARLITLSKVNYMMQATHSLVGFEGLTISLDSINNLIQNRKSLYVRQLNIDSGTVDLNLIKKTDPEKKERINIGLSVQINEINIKQVGISIKNADRAISGRLIDLKLQVVTNEQEHFGWRKAEANLEQMKAKAKAWNVDVAKGYINNEGISSLRDINFKMEKPGRVISITLSSLQWRWPVHHSKIEEIHLPYLQMTKPQIQVIEQTALEETNTPPIQSRLTKSRLIIVDSIDLDATTLTYEGQKDSNRTKLKTNINHWRIFDSQIKRSAQKEPEIMIGRISMIGGPLVFQKNENLQASMQGTTASIDHFYKAGNNDPIRFYLRELGLDSLHFQQAEKDKKKTLDAAHVRFSDHLIHVNKDSLIHMAYDLPDVNLTHTNVSLDNPKSRIIFSNINADLKAKRVSLDSFSLVNKISRDSFFAAQEFEKDYITLRSGHFEINGFDIDKNKKDTGISIKRIDADQFFIMAERDKLRPDDTIAHKPMFTGLAQKIPFPIIIDTIALQRAIIWHNVIAKKTGEQGTIFFTDVTGSLLNVKNHQFLEDDTLRIRVNARLMDKGALYMRFRESYMDSLHGFLLTAKMGKFEMPELNRILVPLILVKITKGHIDTLWLQARANEILAFGQMQIDYRKLHVEKLDLQQKKQGFISLVANIIVRTNNAKDGTIYVERLQNKSIFNYWGRIALSGLLTNIRIASNRMYKKKYELALRKYDLPAHLLDED